MRCRDALVSVVYLNIANVLNIHCDSKQQWTCIVLGILFTYLDSYQPPCDHVVLCSWSALCVCVQVINVNEMTFDVDIWLGGSSCPFLGHFHSSR